MVASTHDEGQDQDQAASALSWRLSWDDNNNNNPSHQSQWLQTTLSDLDKKTKAMLNIMQEDGDSFCERAEMYFKKRPELVEMLEDLHKSHRSLAENYDKLKGHQKLLCSPNSFNQAQQLLQNCHIKIVQETDGTGMEEPTSHLVDPDPDLDNKSSNIDFEDSNMKEPVDENLTKELNKGINFAALEREKMRNELKLKVSELLDDNLREQTELIKRNDENRQVITELGSEINRLKNENRVLKSSLANCNYNKAVDSKQNQVRRSRFTRLFCIKF